MAELVLVEDEEVLRRNLAEALKRSGHAVRDAETAEEGLNLIRESTPDLLLTDFRLPGMDGHDLLLAVKEIDETLPVVMITAHGTVRDAVRAMKAGASDYLSKPVDIGELRVVVDRCLDTKRKEKELEYYRAKDLSDAQLDGIIGESPAIRDLRNVISRLSQIKKKEGGGPTILLTGETGTGKGLVARALHHTSDRNSSPFIEVNCAALPDQLLEAELLGYEKGAFTDAVSSKAGLLEAAQDGTIFLDEIGRMSLELQAKLLKVIEERKVRRLGSTRDRTLGATVIAASHMDLEDAASRGEFLTDLYHRVNVLTIECPPIRERAEDVLLLAEHFIEVHAATYGKDTPPALTDRARKALFEHSWPGNIRELRNTIERAVVLGEGDTIDASEFAFFTRGGGGRGGPAVAISARDMEISFDHGPISLEDVEKRLISAALIHTRGTQVQAALLIGLSRDTLRYRMEKFGIAADGSYDTGEEDE